eukprot:GHVU01146465.1.p3 GENE.GHVU01146465.1~~GHVU01146465.1.p3  ORF type:complete len:121 (-),score=8.84 GHVU01146465.1:2384-2746(-)
MVNNTRSIGRLSFKEGRAAYSIYIYIKKYLSSSLPLSSRTLAAVSVASVSATTPFPSRDSSFDSSFHIRPSSHGQEGGIERRGPEREAKDVTTRNHRYYKLLVHEASRVQIAEKRVRDCV